MLPQGDGPDRLGHQHAGWGGRTTAGGMHAPGPGRGAGLAAKGAGTGRGSVRFRGAGLEAEAAREAPTLVPSGQAGSRGRDSGSSGSSGAAGRGGWGIHPGSGAGASSRHPGRRRPPSPPARCAPAGLPRPLAPAKQTEGDGQPDTTGQRRKGETELVFSSRGAHTDWVLASQTPLFPSCPSLEHGAPRPGHRRHTLLPPQDHWPLVETWVLDPEQLFTAHFTLLASVSPWVKQLGCRGMVSGCLAALEL